MSVSRLGDAIEQVHVRGLPKLIDQLEAFKAKYSCKIITERLREGAFPSGLATHEWRRGKLVNVVTQRYDVYMKVR